MLSALTANINRAENSEPVNHYCFLRYPAAEVEPIPGLDADSAAISLSLVPSAELAVNMISMRERLSSTYIWRSNQWLFNN